MSTKNVKVIIPDNLDETIIYKAEKKKWGVNPGIIPAPTTSTGGLDCAAIGELPAQAWAKGSNVLAQKPDGTCYRVTSVDTIFSDVGVALSASKRSGFVNDEYTVTATVTNSGQGTAETKLLLVKPAGTNYTIKNWSTSSTSGVNVVKNSELEYTITGLAPGANATVTFTVVPKTAATFQFGASVVTSGVDTSTTNNTDSIILSANALTDSNYVATKDCPAIVVTDVDTKKPLALVKTKKSGYPLRTHLDTGAEFAYNAYDIVGLAGRKFKLDGASTVAVYASRQGGDEEPFVSGNVHSTRTGFSRVGNPNAVRFKSGEISFAPSLGTTPYVDRKELPTTTSSTDMVSDWALRTDYTFSNGVLALGSSFSKMTAVLVMMRPAGENCNWQAFVAVSRTPVTKRLATVKGIADTLFSYSTNYESKQWANFGDTVIINPANNASANIIVGELSSGYSSDYAQSGAFIFEKRKAIVSLPRGKAYTFTIETNYKGDIINTKGAVSVSTTSRTETKTVYTVTVAANALPTDSQAIANTFEVNIL